MLRRCLTTSILIGVFILFSTVYADTNPLVIDGTHSIENYETLKSINTTFVLTAKGNSPMPTDAKNGVARVTIPANSPFEFEINLTDEGTYEYTISRETVNSEKLVQDDSVYDVRVAVFSDGSRVVVYQKQGADAKTDEIVYEDTYLTKITHVLNGGKLDGSAKDVVNYYPAGTVITLREAPTKKGYEFTYWKGSKYKANAKYTVTTEDHTFYAQYKKKSTPNGNDEKNGYTERNTRSSAQTGDGIKLIVFIALLSGVVILMAIKMKKR